MKLHDTWQSLGASFNQQGAPLTFGNVNDEVRTLRRDAGIVDRSTRGRIRLTGENRSSLLQALFSNDVALPAGAGVYGFFLTAEGRIRADARVALRSGDILLDVEPQAKNTVLAVLDQYHGSEKIEFEDITEATVQLGVYGPKAPLLFEILFGGASLLNDLQSKTFRFNETDITCIGNRTPGEAGFDAILQVAAGASFLDKLLSLNAKPVGATAFEIARIESGIPRFGVEMNEQTTPLETGLGASGISFTKGCYPGQEVVARINARGETAKRLVGFSVDGPLPVGGATIRRGEREIGTIASALVSPSLRGRPIAMGYVHKDVPDSAEDLYTGETHLWIVPRPFYPPKH